MRRSIVLFPLVAALAVGGCSSNTAAPSDNASFVVTTTPLGSVATDIATCAGGKVTTLMPPGVDPHDFALSSNQGATLAKAKLVIINGLGLEQGIAKSLDSAKADGAKVLEVGTKIDPLPFVEPEGHDEHSDEKSATPGASESAHADEKSDDHGHGKQDPHFWLDPAYMAKAATAMGNEMAAVTGNDKYRTCAGTQAEKLTKLGQDFKTKLDAVPAEKRILVTDHEAFGYFAKAYGFKIVGVAVPGGTTDAKPSAAHLAELAKTVKEHKVPAIFSNSATNPSVVEQIAREAGTKVSVVPLLVESVGEGDKSTYEGMMRSNVDTIIKALGA